MNSQFDQLIQGMDTSKISPVGKHSDDVMEQVNANGTQREVPQSPQQDTMPFVSSPLFETRAFKELVRQDSISRNKSYASNSVNIGGYDIAHNCMKTTLFRMLGFQPTNYANSWLPLGFRAALGTATHNYIQDLSLGKIFTECEVCLKVPSKRISMRLDALINDETLVEIKSCSYTDYKKILTSNKPRLGDLHQAIFYRWLLQNHLEEMKKQEPTRGGIRPTLNDYSNIKYIQMIYICHELISAESDTMRDAIKYATSIRKLAKKESGISDFWFIAPLAISTQSFDIKSHENYLVNKLEELLKYLELKQLPPDDHPYVDNTKCFFCQFKDQCNAGKK